MPTKIARSTKPSGGGMGARTQQERWAEQFGDTLADDYCPPLPRSWTTGERKAVKALMSSHSHLWTPAHAELCLAWVRTRAKLDECEAALEDGMFLKSAKTGDPIKHPACALLVPLNSALVSLAKSLQLCPSATSPTVVSKAKQDAAKKNVAKTKVKTKAKKAPVTPLRSVPAEADPAEADPAEADPAEADPAEADPAEADPALTKLLEDL